MYYVIQVFSKKEEETRKRMIRDLDPSLFIDIFIPKKKRIRKKEGVSFEITETCFPGYLFIETDSPVELKKELYKIKTLTKLLGIDKKHKDYIEALSEDEEEMINILLGKKGSKRTIEISHFYLDENKEIVVVDGPLKGLEGKIIKADFHKRTARVELPLMGQIITADLGIDFIREKVMDDKTNQ